MPELSEYCKAYTIDQLCAFNGWSNGLKKYDDREIEKVESEAQVVYIHDDYIVTTGIYRDQGIIFDDINEEWKAFCLKQLEFEIPTE